jgi:hypothetical protein
VVDQVADITTRVLPNHLVRLATSTYLFSVAGEHLLPENAARAILVEVGGQVTAVSLLRDRVLARTVAIPLGSNALLRAAAPQAASLDEANSKLKMLFDTRAGGGENELPKAVVAALKEWREAVFDAVVSLMHGVTPPKAALLGAGETWYRSYADALGTAWKQPSVRMNASFDVQPLFARGQPKGGSSLGADVDVRSYTLVNAFHEVARAED